MTMQVRSSREMQLFDITMIAVGAKSRFHYPWKSGSVSGVSNPDGAPGLAVFSNGRCSGQTQTGGAMLPLNNAE